MKTVTIFLCTLLVVACSTQQPAEPIVIDESQQKESVAKVIKIDSVWAGHPVGFCLKTYGNRQYIAYYNANRNMVVGQRSLDTDTFDLHTLPPTSRETAGGTSTVLGWDSHNSITLELDKEGYIHLSGNMHAHPITYFRTTQPYDISTLEQHFTLVGPNEQRCTYPKFLIDKTGALIFHYRDGGSGNGNEIYNIYSTSEQRWSRLLEVPLTDGQGLMNAYQSQPTVLEDGWYHVYWVWRDTPDCSTNHDLSYMKSPDLQQWFDAYGQPLKLPATLDKKQLIVDPIPPKGGIINLAARLLLDKARQPVFVYHKYDTIGNLQFYTARLLDDQWVYRQITNWDYRWEFSGRGAINSEVRLKGFYQRTDGNYEVNYWHIKYGDGTILLNKEFQEIGKVLKPKTFAASIEVEGDFPGLQIQTTGDSGTPPAPNTRYLLKWETLNRNRDRPRPEPWPEPSTLYLYELRQPE